MEEERPLRDGVVKSMDSVDDYDSTSEELIVMALTAATVADGQDADDAVSGIEKFIEMTRRITEQQLKPKSR